MNSNKNLICLLFSNTENYSDFLELFFISSILYSNLDRIDFLVFTRDSYVDQLKQISSRFNVSMFIQIVNEQSIFNPIESIFQFKEIDSYSKILYLTVNTLIQNDFTDLFNLDLGNTVYTLNNYPILFFKMNKEIKNINSKDYNVDLLNTYIYMVNNTIPVSPEKNSTLIMNYFNNELNKSLFIKMKYHMEHLLKVYTKQGFKCKNINPILYKQYSWDSGRVVFHKDDVIITTWGRGIYNFLEPRIVQASWHNNTHVLIFNKEFTEYTSIHLDTAVVKNGKIDTSLQDTIPISSIQLKPRQLVYFCAFHNKGYIDLLTILLSCVKIFCTTDTIDFLVFTSESFVPIIHDLSDKLNIPIQIQTFDFTTQHEAGCARLYIFNYKNIDQYEKILYIDTDITIQNDLSRIFEYPIEDKVYAVQEYDINGEGHGAWFFDFSTIDPLTPAINSGVLLFQNTRKIRMIFNDIIRHITDLKKTQSIIPNCMDQSFIVYHLFRNSAYNSTFLKDYVYLSEHIQPPKPESPTNLTLVHYVWPIGNTGHKLNRMIEHTRNIFNNYSLLCPSALPYSGECVMNKIYSWNTTGSKGQIEFNENGSLKTTWGEGKYIQLDAKTFDVSWSIHYHILKMDSNYTTYVGFNKYNIESIQGSLINTARKI